uniref:Uncharacterized protein n=1 Tax=Rhizophora mucronata TaxID=61149 RepID=A0A2P2IV16_RHIMU
MKEIPCGTFSYFTDEKLHGPKSYKAQSNYLPLIQATVAEQIKLTACSCGHAHED